MYASDASTFLADFGCSAAWTPIAGGATVTGMVIFGQPTEVIEGGDGLSRQYEATLAVADWPGLKRSEVLVIQGEGGGHSYRLRTDLHIEADGVFATAPLTKVS